jgi:hypothetical protein
METRSAQPLEEGAQNRPDDPRSSPARPEIDTMDPGSSPAQDSGFVPANARADPDPFCNDPIGN